MSFTGKRSGADNEIDAMNNQLVISLLRILSWRCRLAHKVVWEGLKIYVDIKFRIYQTLFVEYVQVTSIDQLDHGTYRKCRDASVQNGIVPTDCGDTHVPAGVLCLSFAQKTGLLSLLVKVEQTHQV